MADQNARASGEWDWLEESELRLMCVLIFARDITQDELFEAFDLDPSSARMEDRIYDPGHRRIRAGRLGAWTFAIDEQGESLNRALHGKNVGKRLSAGTEVVVVSWTPKPTEDFEYWADGSPGDPRSGAVQGVTGMAIRLAVGAEPRTIQALFFRPGLILMCLGSAIGSVSARGLSPWMATLLFGVKPFDLLGYAIQVWSSGRPPWPPVTYQREEPQL
jgi:hypothetical protein